MLINSLDFRRFFNAIVFSFFSTSFKIAHTLCTKYVIQLSFKPYAHSSFIFGQFKRPSSDEKDCNSRYGEDAS